MTDEHNGTAPDSGDMNQDQGQNGTNPDKKEKSVPYERFQKVNEAKKQAEATLQAIVDDLKAEIPEEFADLVPELSPAETLKWMRLADKKGLFGKVGVSEEIDSKRPGSKQNVSFDNMSPLEMIGMGLK